MIGRMLSIIVSSVLPYAINCSCFWLVLTCWQDDTCCTVYYELLLYFELVCGLISYAENFWRGTEKVFHGIFL